MPSSSFRHRVDDYARAVLAGDIVAGPFVRMACERHVRDRQRAADDPTWYQFDEDRADLVISFFERVLKLPDVVDEEGDPKAFLLSGWQAFVLGSLFGWVDLNGVRRFREGYIETGKGSGKSPMLAGVGLYGLMMDGERAAEIYSAAADQEQAKILFVDAIRIAKASGLDGDEGGLTFSGIEHIWEIKHNESLSTFRTFSREGGQKSGPRPSMGLLDELHEHPTPDTSLKIRAGAKRRKQPLFLEITNSGYDRTSICWQRHEHARKVVERVVEDDQLFAYVCALDKDDDPLEDESCWVKTNPNLGVTPSVEYLRRQVSNAKNIQAETNGVLRLNFCVWTLAHSRAIDIMKWQACQPMPSEAELIGAECFGCLDLGETDDFSAFGTGWALKDGRVAIRMRFYLPEIALQRYPNRPYAEWQKAGLLILTPGEATDQSFIREDIKKDVGTYGMKSVFFDQRHARETANIMIGEGVDMVPILQGFQLSEAIKRLLELVTTGFLCHGNELILTWMAANLVLVTGAKGERRIDKMKAPDKIDGMAALVMWIEGALVRREREPEPTYAVMVFGGKKR